MARFKWFLIFATCVVSIALFVPNSEAKFIGIVAFGVLTIVSSRKGFNG